MHALAQRSRACPKQACVHASQPRSLRALSSERPRAAGRALIALRSSSAAHMLRAADDSAVPAEDDGGAVADEVHVAARIVSVGLVGAQRHVHADRVALLRRPATHLLAARTDRDARWCGT